MALASEAETPYRVVDDFVDAEAVKEALDENDECALHWFESARDDFTVDGICWPEVDWASMGYFWRNVRLATKLADAFKKTGIQEFRFFRHFSPRPQIGPSKSDVCSVLWEAELPGISRPLISFEELRLSRFTQSVKRACRRLVYRMGKPAAPASSNTPRVSPGGILVVMASVEALRFTNLLRLLAKHFPGETSVAMTAPFPRVEPETLWGESVPIVYGPAFPPASWLPRAAWKVMAYGMRDLARRFLNGYLKTTAASGGRPWKRPLETLRFHFEYYCLHRWPWLHQRNLRFWSDLWAQTQPRLVLISSVDDAPFRLPSTTAKLHGIPTLAVPHGGVFGARTADIPPMADSSLYGIKLQKRLHELLGLPPSRLFACKDLVAPNEYPIKINASPYSSHAKLRLLALTETTDEGTNLVKSVSLSSQYAALKALSEPPADIESLIELAVKVHPNYHDIAIIAAVGPTLRSKVMPLDSDLHQIIEEVDLVVAVNYYGSALIHVLRAGKPVLYFLTERDPLVNREQSWWFKLFLDGTTLARTSEEFWNLVRSFLADPMLAAAMSRKAEKFARDNLDDSGFPCIGEVIDDLMISRGPGAT